MSLASTQLPRAKAVVHTGPDVLSPSTEEEVSDFLMGTLRARRDWMEVWTERMREWFSSKLLKPLVRQVQAAHEPVNQVGLTGWVLGAGAVPNVCCWADIMYVLYSGAVQVPAGCSAPALPARRHQRSQRFSCGGH